MGGKSTQELALLDQASQALAEARSLDEIKVIRDKAEAVRKYAQSASMGLDVQNRAAEVKLRAERQAGKLLGQLMLRGGDRRSKGHRNRLKLDDLGLTANQSKRWQLEAKVPEDLFREHVTHTCTEGKELTSAGLMRFAKRLKGESANRNGHPDGHDTSRRQYILQCSDRSAIGGSGGGEVGLSDVGQLVDELKNHHVVLDGILQPLYDAQTPALRSAELRMLRYLMAEMGSLIAHLTTLEESKSDCSYDKGRVGA
jgi:hypothetical protein